MIKINKNILIHNIESFIISNNVPNRQEFDNIISDFPYVKDIYIPSIFDLY